MMLRWLSHSLSQIRLGLNVEGEPNFGIKSRRLGFLKKRQNVMAVTDVVALFWQSQNNQKRVTPWKR
jgi:hypothetical protein